MSEKFETNGIKELNHQVFLKKYLGTLMPNHWARLRWDNVIILLTPPLP